jgi:membrane protein
VIRSSKVWQFLTRDIWKISTRSVARGKQIPFKALKLGLLSIKGFRKDRASLRAAALTLYTLLSIVPVLAVLFGIAKGFGLDARLETWIYSQFPDQQGALGPAVVFARRALERTEGGLIAGTGVILLLYSVIMVASNIEHAMNHIWCVAKQRSWGRRFSDYLSLILIGPFLLLGASSLNLYLAGWARHAGGVLGAELIDPLARLAFQALSVILLWVLFSFTYVFMPNTKVRLRSGLLGGAVAALLYQLVQTLYLQSQIGATRNNAIYGSFAALPLFVVWLQASWHIVLFGAEVTHHHQHYQNNELEERMPTLSFRAIKRLGLAASEEVIRRFVRGEPAPSGQTLGGLLQMPSQVLGNLLGRLVDAGILVGTAAGHGSETVYAPARDPQLLTPGVILDSLERVGEDLDERVGEAFDDSARALGALDRCLKESPALATAPWAPEPRGG